MDIANLIDIDNSILLLLNGGESVFVDTLMLTLTSGLTWIPLYIALLFLVIKNNEKWSYILLIISCVGLSLILSGGVSDHIVKDMVARPRPINEPSLYGIISPIRGYQAFGYSFYSSHAANTMSVAVFFILLVPIIFLIIGMLFELSKVLNEKLKIKHIEEDYIYYLKENTYKEEELDSFLNKNDISSNEVVINSNEICITKKVPSNFGKIINKNTYQIKVCTNKK